VDKRLRSLKGKNFKAKGSSVTLSLWGGETRIGSSEYGKLPRGQSSIGGGDERRWRGKKARRRTMRFL